VPKRLRLFFKYDRRLLGELCRAALRALGRYFEAVTGSALTPGVIAAIQTYREVTEGGVDEAGVFRKISRIDDSRLEELFCREVLDFLVRRELLSPQWAERVLSWRHTGFSVHSRVLSVSFLMKPSVVDRIIDHLKLVFVAERPPPPQAVFQELLWEAAPPNRALSRYVRPMSSLRRSRPGGARGLELAVPSAASAHFTLK